MRKWLPRFAFSLLIIGGFLLYQAFKLSSGPERLPTWQIVLLIVGGVMAASMGMTGIRERHRQMREHFDR